MIWWDPNGLIWRGCWLCYGGGVQPRERESVCMLAGGVSVAEQLTHRFINKQLSRNQTKTLEVSMAICNFGGTSNIQLFKLDFTSSSSPNLCPFYGIRPWNNVLPFRGLVLSRRSPHLLTVHCVPSPQVQALSNLEDDLDIKQSVENESRTIPTASEVESLLSEICDTATIAEFEVKFGGFRLYVTRDLAGENRSSPPPSSPPVSSTPVQTHDSNGSVSGYSLAISKLTPSEENQTLRERAKDEGLVIVNSPSVGNFRRSKMIKGKPGRPPCKENQNVKEGQVLCYIEQIGGEIPVESHVAGEVVKMLKEDGDPVGYGDALVKILPSFPGIKKLQ